MDTENLQHVMMETLFLIALAITKRVGELQAVSAGEARHGKDWVLSYPPEFIAKMETPPPPTYEEVSWWCLAQMVRIGSCVLSRSYIIIYTWHRPFLPLPSIVSLEDHTCPMPKMAVSYFK